MPAILKVLYYHSVCLLGTFHEDGLFWDIKSAYGTFTLKGSNWIETSIYGIFICGVIVDNVINMSIKV